MICPKCRSSNCARERRPNGKTRCLDCKFECLSSEWDNSPDVRIKPEETFHLKRPGEPLMYDVVENLQGEALKAQQEAEDKIIELLDNPHNHTHNVVGIVLRNLAKDYGYKYANTIVEKFELVDKLGIEPVRSQ